MKKRLLLLALIPVITVALSLSGCLTMVRAAREYMEISKTYNPMPRETNFTNANSYTNNKPIININEVSLNPKKVYYEGSRLIMVAYISNGYQDRTIVNLRDIYIKLSNKDGVIAEAIFFNLPGIQIKPQNYITYAFIFEEGTVYVQNADLSSLFWNFYINYDY